MPRVVEVYHALSRDCTCWSPFVSEEDFYVSVSEFDLLRIGSPSKSMLGTVDCM